MRLIKALGDCKQRSLTGGHATACFLEGFIEGSLSLGASYKVLRRRLVRASIETKVLRRVLRRGGVIEGA